MAIYDIQMQFHIDKELPELLPYQITCVSFAKEYQCYISEQSVKLCFVYVFPVLGILKGKTTAYLKQDRVLSYVFMQVIHQCEESVP